MKILLVDDSPTQRHAMSSYIKAAGHEPVVATSGEEALQLIDETTDVDLIIMDVEMPGLNGFETTKLIREYLGERWIPIIFVTGRIEEESLKEGIEVGGDDYLIKPVSQVIISAKIRAMERITSMRDQLSKLNDELETLSQLDSLTQIYNRRTFNTLARKHWQTANRRQEPITALMLDVDHFKLFNDHYGHPAGDACLQQVAGAIKGALRRPEDILGRYGGEEFIVVLPETDELGAAKVGENIRRAVETLKLSHERSSTSQYVTVSVGGASSLHTTGRTLDDLTKQADQALYKSKETGRNRVTIEDIKPHKTVLIVDDDHITLELLQVLLGDHCNIITADNGAECLDIAQDIFPDLILLDIHMPGIDGVEVCKQLKNNTQTSVIPVIFMSVDDRATQVKIGRQAGVNDCIEKPIDENRLLAKVNRFLL